MAVHYSATTMCPSFVHFSSYLQSVPLECLAQSRNERTGPPAPLSPHPALGLRRPRRSPRALPVCYATDVVEYLKYRPPPYNGKSHCCRFLAALCPYTKSNSCSWAGRRRRLHGPRRAAMTVRTVGPGPCTFRYARTLLLMCDLVKRGLCSQKKKVCKQSLGHRLRIVRWIPTLPGVRTTPRGIEEECTTN